MTTGPTSCKALVPLTGAYFIDVAVQWGVVSDLLRWFLSSILVTVVAAFLRVAFWFVDETQSLVRTRKRKVDQEAQVTEKIRTYRYKEGIVADERLPGEYPLRDVLAGDLDRLVKDLTEQETARRLAEL